MIGAARGNGIGGADVFDGNRACRRTVGCSTTGCCGGIAECVVTAGSGCEFSSGGTCKLAARHTCQKSSRKVLLRDDFPREPVFPPSVGQASSRLIALFTAWRV